MIPFLSKRRFRTAVALFLVLVLTACGGRPDAADAEDALEPTVILISLDGFRWDYLERYEAPALEQLARNGVRAEKLIPIFPTKTFPNHYSAVTGLYADGHGIISNTMHDPEIGDRFSLSNRDAIEDPRWWGGEPIWVTAEKQGQTAATYFWPGSEAPIQGVRPTYWFRFDGDVPGDERVDQVLQWLNLPAEERPTFITLYFSDVDGAGHRHGPDSPEVAEAVARVDSYVRRLVFGLRDRSVLDDVNLLITSDHGMAETSPERVVILDDYFNPDEARIVDYSPVLMMYPPDGDAQSVYEALRADPHVQVYWKDELPDRYHLQHPRTPPFIAVAEPGWEIATRSHFERDPDSFRGGAHGYDHESPSMAGLFIAHGPNFRRAYVAPPFEMVELYNLMCDLLGLSPAPNDGHAGALHHLLSEKSTNGPDE